MFYNITFYFRNVYPLQHHLLFYFPHQQHHPHVLATAMLFKLFTTWFNLQDITGIIHHLQAANQAVGGRKVPR